MADLYSIAQIVYDQVYPNSSVNNPITINQFIETAKLIYAERLFYLRKEERREDGEWNVPSELLVADIFEVKNNQIDLSGKNIMKSLPNDGWLQSIGEGCGCTYFKIHANHVSMYCEDDLIGNDKPFFLTGSKINFPKGAHAASISLVYASNGSDIEDSLEVDDMVGAFVRVKLLEIYTRKQPEDKTNNNSINN